MRELEGVAGRRRRTPSGRPGQHWSIVLVALAGLISLAAGCGSPGSAPVRTQAAPAATTTTRWTKTVEVTCPGLGSVSVALPSGVASPPLPPEVVLSIGYQATDTSTNIKVSGGQPPGEIPCGTVPFNDLPAQQVTTGAPQAGVAPGDRLTGSWAVSATVTLLSNPTVP